MSDAIFGKGTLLQVDSGGGYTTVAEVRSISGPGGEAEEVDVTNHDSPGRTREFVQGLIDQGEISATVNFQPDNATHADLLTKQSTGVTEPWRINWAQMTTPHALTFNGFVKTVSFESPVDDVLQGNISIRVADQPALGVTV